MIKKEVAGKKVIKAMSLGLAAAMATMQPMAALAEETAPVVAGEEPAAEAPVVVEPTVEPAEAPNIENPVTENEINSTELKLGEAAITEAVAGAEAVPVLNISIINNEAAAVIKENQAAGKLEDAKDAMSAGEQQVSGDLEAAQQNLDNSNAASQNAIDAAKAASDDLVKANEASEVANSASSSSAAAPAVADAKAAAESAQNNADTAKEEAETAKSEYEKYVEAYNQAVADAEAAIKEANDFIAAGDEKAQEAVERANKALKAANDYKDKKEEILADADGKLDSKKEDLQKAGKNLEKAALDLAAAEFKLGVAVVDDVEAAGWEATTWLALETAKGIEEIADWNLEQKEAYVKQLEADKKAAEDKIAEKEAEVEGLLATKGAADTEVQNKISALENAKKAIDAINATLKSANQAFEEAKSEAEKASKEFKEVQDKVNTEGYEKTVYDAEKAIEEAGKNDLLTEEVKQDAIEAGIKTLVGAVVFEKIAKDSEGNVLGETSLEDGAKTADGKLIWKVTADDGSVKYYSYNIDAEDGSIDIYEYTKNESRTKNGTEQTGVTDLKELGEEGKDYEILATHEGSDALYEVKYYGYGLIDYEKDEHVTLYAKNMDVQKYPSDSKFYNAVGSEVEFKNGEWRVKWNNRKLDSYELVTASYKVLSQKMGYGIITVEDVEASELSNYEKNKSYSKKETTPGTPTTYDVKVFSTTVVPNVSESDLKDYGVEGEDYVKECTQLEQQRKLIAEAKYEVYKTKKEEVKTISYKKAGDAYDDIRAGKVTFNDNRVYYSDGELYYFEGFKKRTLGEGQQVKVTTVSYTDVKYDIHEVDESKLNKWKGYTVSKEPVQPAEYSDYQEALYTVTRYSFTNNISYTKPDEDIDGSGDSVLRDYNDRKAADEAAATAKTNAEDKVKALTNGGTYKDADGKEVTVTEEESFKKIEEIALQAGKDLDKAIEDQGNAEQNYNNANAELKQLEDAYDAYYEGETIAKYFSIIRWEWVEIKSQSEYEKAHKQAEEDVREARGELLVAKGVVIAAREVYNDAVDKHEDAKEKLADANREVLNKSLALISAGSAYDKALAAKNKAQKAYDAAEAADNYAALMQQTAQKAYNEAVAAEKALADLMNRSDVGKDQLADAKVALEEAEKNYKDALEAAENAQKDADAAKDAYEEALAKFNSLVDEERRRAEENNRYYGGDEDQNNEEDYVFTVGNTVITIPGADIDLTGVDLNMNQGGVLGARKSRVASKKAAADEAVVDDIAVVADEEVKEVVLDDEEENKKEETKEVVSIDEEEVPLAAELPIEDAKGMSWWWLLIIAVLGGTGYEIYRKSQQKKEKVQK